MEQNGALLVSVGVLISSISCNESDVRRRYLSQINATVCIERVPTQRKSRCPLNAARTVGFQLEV